MTNRDESTWIQSLVRTVRSCSCFQETTIKIFFTEKLAGHDWHRSWRWCFFLLKFCLSKIEISGFPSLFAVVIVWLWDCHHCVTSAKIVITTFWRQLFCHRDKSKSCTTKTKDTKTTRENRIIKLLSISS